MKPIRKTVKQGAILGRASDGAYLLHLVGSKRNDFLLNGILDKPTSRLAALAIRGLVGAKKYKSPGHSTSLRRTFKIFF